MHLNFFWIFLNNGHFLVDKLLFKLTQQILLLGYQVLFFNALFDQNLCCETFFRKLVLEFILDLKWWNFDGVAKPQINDASILFFRIQEKKVRVNLKPIWRFEAILKPLSLNFGFLAEIVLNLMNKSIQV